MPEQLLDEQSKLVSQQEETQNSGNIVSTEQSNAETEANDGNEPLSPSGASSGVQRISPHSADHPLSLLTQRRSESASSAAPSGSSPTASSTPSGTSLQRGNLGDAGFIHPFMVAIQQQQQQQQQQAHPSPGAAMAFPTGTPKSSSEDLPFAAALSPRSTQPFPRLSSSSQLQSSLPAPTSATSTSPPLPPRTKLLTPQVPAFGTSTNALSPPPPPPPPPPPGPGTTLLVSPSSTASAVSASSSAPSSMPQSPLSPSSSSASRGPLSPVPPSPMVSYLGPRLLNGPLPYVLGPPHTRFFYGGSFHTPSTDSKLAPPSWYELGKRFGLPPESIGPGADAALSPVGEVPLSLLLAPAAPLIALCGCSELHPVVARALSLRAGVVPLDAALTAYSMPSTDPIANASLLGTKSVEPQASQGPPSDEIQEQSLQEQQSSLLPRESGFGNASDLEHALSTDVGSCAIFGIGDKESNETPVPYRFISIEGTHSFPPPKPPRPNHEMYNPSGILKVHWLAKHLLHIPCAAILFYEYKDNIAYDPQESSILQAAIQFRTNCVREVPFIIVLVRSTGQAKSQVSASTGTSSGASYESVSLTLQTRLPGLAKRAQLDPSQVIAVTLHDLRRDIPRIESALSSLASNVMKGRIKACKSVLSKLNKSHQQGLIARYNFKAAVFAESIRDHVLAQKYYRAAIAALYACLSPSQKGSNSSSSGSSANTGIAPAGSAAAAAAMRAALPTVAPAVAQSIYAIEVRSVHAVVTMRLARALMQAAMITDAVDLFQEHLVFVTKCAPGPLQFRTLLLNHLARQHFAFGELLSQLAPTIQNVTKQNRHVLAPYYYLSAARYESAREALAEAMLQKLHQGGYQFDEVGRLPHVVTTSTSSVALPALLGPSSAPTGSGSSTGGSYAPLGPMRPPLYVGQPFPSDLDDIALFHSPSKSVPVASLASLASMDKWSQALLRLAHVNNATLFSEDADVDALNSSVSMFAGQPEVSQGPSQVPEGEEGDRLAEHNELDVQLDPESADSSTSSPTSPDPGSEQHGVKVETVSPVRSTSGEDQPARSAAQTSPSSQQQSLSGGYASPTLYLDHRLSRAVFAFDRWQRGPQTALFYLAKADDRIRSVQPARLASITPATPELAHLGAAHSGSNFAPAIVARELASGVPKGGEDFGMDLLLQLDSIASEVLEVTSGVAQSISDSDAFQKVLKSRSSVVTQLKSLPTPEALIAWMGFTCAATSPVMHLPHITSAGTSVGTLKTTTASISSSTFADAAQGTLAAVIERISQCVGGKPAILDYPLARLAWMVSANAALIHLHAATYLTDKLAALLSPLLLASDGEIICDKVTTPALSVSEIAKELEWLEERLPIHDPLSRQYLLPHSRLKCPFQAPLSTVPSLQTNLPDDLNKRISRIIFVAKRFALAAHAILVPLVQSRYRIAHFTATLTPLLPAAARAAGLAGDTPAQARYLLELLAPGPAAASYSPIRSHFTSLLTAPPLRAQALVELMCLMPKLVSQTAADLHMMEGSHGMAIREYSEAARRSILAHLRSKIKQQATAGSSVMSPSDLISLLEWFARLVAYYRIHHPALIWSPLLRQTLGRYSVNGSSTDSAARIRPLFVIPQPHPPSADPSAHAAAAAAAVTALTKTVQDPKMIQQITASVPDGSLALRSESTYAVHAPTAAHPSSLPMGPDFLLKGASPLEVSYVFMTRIEDAISGICAAGSTPEAKMLASRVVLNVGESFLFVIAITSYLPIAVYFSSISFTFNDANYNFELKYVPGVGPSKMSNRKRVITIDTPLLFGSFQTRHFAVSIRAHSATAVPVSLEAIVRGQGDWRKIVSSLLVPDVTIANAVLQHKQKSLAAAYAASAFKDLPIPQQRITDDGEGFRGVSFPSADELKRAKYQYPFREGPLAMAPGQIVTPHVTHSNSCVQEELASVNDDLGLSLNSLEQSQHPRLSDLLPRPGSGLGLGRLECLSAIFELPEQSHLSSRHLRLLADPVTHSSLPQKLQSILTSFAAEFDTPTSDIYKVQDSGPSIRIQTPCRALVPSAALPTPHQLLLPPVTPFRLSQDNDAASTLRVYNSSISRLKSAASADSAGRHWTEEIIVVSESAAKPLIVNQPVISSAPRTASDAKASGLKLRQDPEGIPLSALVSPLRALVDAKAQDSLPQVLQPHASLTILHKLADSLPQSVMVTEGEERLRKRMFVGETAPVEFQIPPVEEGSDVVDVAVVLVQVDNVDVGVTVDLTSDNATKPGYKMSRLISEIRGSTWKKAASPTWTASMNEDGILSIDEDLTDVEHDDEDEEDDDEDVEDEEDEENVDHGESAAKQLRNDRNQSRAFHVAKRVYLARSMLCLTAPQLVLSGDSSQVVAPVFVGAPGIDGPAGRLQVPSSFSLPVTEPTCVSSRLCKVHGAEMASALHVDPVVSDVDGQHGMASVIGATSESPTDLPVNQYVWKTVFGDQARVDLPPGVKDSIPHLIPCSRVGQLVASFAESIDWEGLAKRPRETPQVLEWNRSGTSSGYTPFAFVLPKSTATAGASFKGQIRGPQLPCKMQITLMVLRRHLTPPKDLVGVPPLQVLTRVFPFTVRNPFGVSTQYLRAPTARLPKPDSAAPENQGRARVAGESTPPTFEYFASTVLVPTPGPKGESRLGRLCLTAPDVPGNSLICGSTTLVKVDVTSIAGCRCARIPYPITRATAPGEQKDPAEINRFTDYGASVAEVNALEEDAWDKSTTADALYLHGVDVHFNPRIFEISASVGNANRSLTQPKVLFSGDRFGIVRSMKVRPRVPASAISFFGYAVITYSRGGPGSPISKYYVPLKQAYLVSEAHIRASISHPLVTRLDKPIPVSLTVHNSSPTLPAIVRFAVDSTAPALLPPIPSKPAAGTHPWPAAAAQLGYPATGNLFNSAGGLLASSGLPHAQQQPMSPAVNTGSAASSSGGSVLARDPVYSVAPPILPTPQMVVLGRAFQLLAVPANSQRTVTFEFVPLASGQMSVPPINITVAVPAPAEDKRPAQQQDGGASATGSYRIDETTLSQIGTILAPNWSATPANSQLASKFVFAALTSAGDFGSVFVEPPKIVEGRTDLDNQ